MMSMRPPCFFWPWHAMARSTKFVFEARARMQPVLGPELATARAAPGARETPTQIISGKGLLRCLP
eukprot:219932-Alexandrium_andersonii.AAC.1